MAVFDADVSQMTLVFLCVVAALAVALVRMFCVLEHSPQLARLRTALIRRVDGGPGRH